MNPLLSNFARACKNDGTLIHKALTSAAGVGAALIPQSLEKIITDTVIRLSPELYLMTMLSIASKNHEFNRLTERPNRGGAMGENSTTPVSNSKTVRDNVNLKIVKRKGRVSGYLQDTSREYIDSVAYEMDNELQAHVLDMIYYIYRGNKDGKTYVNSVEEQTPDVEFDGLERYISSNRVNKASGGTVLSSLKEIDDMIDASRRKGSARHKLTLAMGPEMLSTLSRLLTNVRLQQPIDGRGITVTDIGGGHRLAHYRDIPIIETTSLTPIETLSSVITLAQEDTAVGSLSDGTFFVYIEPITYEGEQMPKSEQSVVLSAGTATQRIRISLDAAHKSVAGVENVLSYRIFVGTTTGAANCKLVKEVPAFVYDSDNAPSGDNGVGTNYIWIPSLTPGSDVATQMVNDTPLQDTGGKNPESIILWDLDPIQGLGKLPFTNTAGSDFQGLITTEPLAKIEDYTQFLIKSYVALTNSFEATSYWVRGLRTA